MNQIKLQNQMDRFIKSGFKMGRFTNDLYEMLYIHSNQFIAHFDKTGFHHVRFNCQAENTVKLLRIVKKPELRPLCLQLADAMESRLRTRTETKEFSSAL